MGEKLLVETMYSDDEKNAVTHNVLALHLGGVDSLSRQSGIHGHHLDQYEYVATDSTYQTIIAVNKHSNPDGSITQYVSTDLEGAGESGVTRQMDCGMDCHQQATHVFQTAGRRDQRGDGRAAGGPNPALPQFVHKKGLELIQADYKSQDEAAQKITAGVDSFYQSQYPAIWSGQRGAVDAAAKSLRGVIYKRNVFPDMKVARGGHTPVEWDIARRDIIRRRDASAATMAVTLRRMARPSPTTARCATICWPAMRRIPSSCRIWGWGSSRQAKGLTPVAPGYGVVGFKTEGELSLRQLLASGWLSSSRMASISARACWLRVRLAAAMPACRRETEGFLRAALRP